MTRIIVNLDLETRYCDCCARTHMDKTFELEVLEDASPPEILHLGVMCAGRWFGTALTGNIYRACDRLARKIKVMTEAELKNVIKNIKRRRDGL